MGMLDRWASKVSGPDGTYDGPPPPRPLTAAGVRINLASPAMIHTKRPAWQEDAWTYRENVPEMRFSGEFVGFAMGRLRLFGAENRTGGDDPIPLDTDPGKASTDTGITPETRQAVAVALARLNLNAHGASLLGRCGENLEYAGEAYLLGEDTDDGPTWTVRSVSEVQVTMGGARLVEPGTGAATRTLDPDTTDLLRLWNPHPRFYEWPDSPVASLLDVLEGMVLINRRGRAHDRSRISSGKGLYVPTEFSMSTPGSGPISAAINGLNVEESGDPLQESLEAFMSAPIRDETDPSAVVPLLFRGPAQIGDRPAKEVIGTFDLHGEDPKDLDDRYEALVTRFARGINLSPERVKGMGDTNHWSAASITADEVTTAIAPRAARMCDALTAAYLRPTLKAMGVPPEQRAKVCIWFDASRLAQKPNRSEDAKAAHTAGTISDAALRDALGFTDDDAPGNLEMLRRAVDRERLAPASVPILIKLLTGQMPTQTDISGILADYTSTGRPIRRTADPHTIDAAPADRTPTSQVALPAGERMQPATAPAGITAAAKQKPGPKDDPTGPSVAGIALIDSLTGRVLMLQRGLDDPTDPAAGTWEFPGGHVEPSDDTSLHAGMREWAEEVGRPFPSDDTAADVADTWVSPNGVYRGHIVVLPGAEQLVDLDGPRTVSNADDDYSEQSAWWDIDMARRMGPALRPEVRAGTPWPALRKAAKEHAPAPTSATTAAAGRTQDGKYATPDHARRWRVDRPLGKQLVAIDQHLTDRVLAHSEATVGRIVEKLANRIRSDATALNGRREPKDPVAAAAFPKGTDPRTVCAAAGPGVGVNTSGQVIDQLLATALDDLETLWLDEAGRAGQAVEELLDGVIGSFPTQMPVTAAGGARGVAARILANARDAWNRLRERLRQHALNVLYGRHVPSRDGERSPGIVPVSIIRPAIFETGGVATEATVDDGGLVPSTGPGTGEIALDTLRVAGAAELGWEWVYPPAPRQHFPGHQKLHGVEFTSWTDPVLDAGADADWIGPFYSPGDHEGCLCYAEPYVAIPMVPDASLTDPDLADLAVRSAA